MSHASGASSEEQRDISWVDSEGKEAPRRSLEFKKLIKLARPQRNLRNHMKILMKFHEIRWNLMKCHLFSSLLPAWIGFAPSAHLRKLLPVLLQCVVRHLPHVSRLEGVGRRPKALPQQDASEQPDDLGHRLIASLKIFNLLTYLFKLYLYLL